MIDYSVVHAAFVCHTLNLSATLFNDLQAEVWSIKGHFNSLIINVLYIILKCCLAVTGIQISVVGV